MKNSLLTLLAAGAVLALGANNLHAQGLVPFALNVKLTVQVQGLFDEPTGNPAVKKSTITKLKMTNKDFLRLLEVAYGTTFTGGRVVIAAADGTDVLAGDFLVLDSGGNVLANATASGFFNGLFDEESNFIRQGISNTSTGSEKTADIFLNTIFFNDSAHTNDFFFSGAEQEDFSLNGNNGKFTDSFNLNGAGTGELLTLPLDAGISAVPFFILTGTISGQVRGVL